MINGLDIYYSKNVGKGLAPVSKNKTGNGLSPISKTQNILKLIKGSSC